MQKTATGRTKDQNVTAFGPTKCYVNQKLIDRILFSSDVNYTTFVNYQSVTD